MGNKREYEYKITTERIDFTRRATIKAMFDCVLDSAGLDAYKNGFGAHDMAVKMHAAWVLIRMCMNIYELPQEDDVVHVRTWVSDITSISSTRNFEMVNDKGEVLAAAVSLWTIINIDTRKMVPVNSLICYADMAQPEFGMPVAAPLRLKAPDPDACFTHTVCYSDIDFNRHAHSTNYLQWALDTLPIDELITSRKVRVDVNFVHETKLGETVTIKRNAVHPY